MWRRTLPDNPTVVMRDVVDSVEIWLLRSRDRFRNPRRGDPELPRRVGEGQPELPHEVDRKLRPHGVIRDVASFVS